MVFKILVITPTKHIKKFRENFPKKYELEFYEDIEKKTFSKIANKFDGIYTNPNKLKFKLNKETIPKIGKLKVICTASTGTDHLDIKYFKKQNVKILSLTKDFNLLNRLSATAELAFAFSLLSIRNIIYSYSDVKKGNWNYTKFIGNQFDNLNVGIIGFGRLGKKYARYCKAFNAKVHIYDPFKKIPKKYIKIHSLKSLFKKCEIISLHVHLNNQTKHLISKDLLKESKNNLKLINTSRGGVVNEKDLISFLKSNKKAKYFTDVIENEYIEEKLNSNILRFMNKNNQQVVITPHIGGMTIESQTMAFNFAAKKLVNFFKK